tara:strand:+ start:83 stop:391 length:309 start_codon:yes stop_codon:yes gene_type:complete
MSDRDLIQELKATITDLQEEKDSLSKTISSKERRIKQVTLKLEHATQDVKSVGHKVAEKDKEIAQLHAKLETKEGLLKEALTKIKEIRDDSTDPNAESSELA